MPYCKVFSVFFIFYFLLIYFLTFNQYAYFPCSGYDTDEESSLNNQEPPQLMIISFLLVTLMIQGYYCNDTKD